MKCPSDPSLFRCALDCRLRTLCIYLSVRRYSISLSPPPNFGGTIYVVFTCHYLWVGFSLFLHSVWCLCRMVGGLGGSLCRTPARAHQAEEARNGKTVPELVHVVAKISTVASSRPPPLAVHTPATRLKRKLEWPVETPRLPSRRRFAPRGEETLSRASPAPRGAIAATPRGHRAKTAYGGSVQRKPTTSARKPACIVHRSGGARGLGSGFSMAVRCLPATVVNSVEVPHYELQEDPSFWMENNVQVRHTAEFFLLLPST